MRAKPSAPHTCCLCHTRHIHNTHARTSTSILLRPDGARTPQQSRACGRHRLRRPSKPTGETTARVQFGGELGKSAEWLSICPRRFSEVTPEPDGATCSACRLVRGGSRVRNRGQARASNALVPQRERDKRKTLSNTLLLCLKIQTHAHTHTRDIALFPQCRSVHFFPTLLAASRERFRLANHCHLVPELLAHRTYVIWWRQRRIFRPDSVNIVYGNGSGAVIVRCVFVFNGLGAVANLLNDVATSGSV